MNKEGKKLLTKKIILKNREKNGLGHAKIFAAIESIVISKQHCHTGLFLRVTLLTIM